MVYSDMFCIFSVILLLSNCVDLFSILKLGQPCNNGSATAGRLLRLKRSNSRKKGANQSINHSFLLFIFSHWIELNRIELHPQCSMYRTPPGKRMGPWTCDIAVLWISSLTPIDSVSIVGIQNKSQNLVQSDWVESGPQMKQRGVGFDLRPQNISLCSC